MPNKTTLVQLIICASCALFATDYVLAQSKDSFEKKPLLVAPPDSQERGSLIAKETLTSFEFIKSKDLITEVFLEEFKRFEPEVTVVESVDILKTETNYYLAAYAKNNPVSLYAELVKRNGDLFLSRTMTQLLKCQGNPCDKCKLNSSKKCVCSGQGTSCNQSTQAIVQFRSLLTD